MLRLQLAKRQMITVYLCWYQPPSTLDEVLRPAPRLSRVTLVGSREANSMRMWLTWIPLVGFLTGCGVSTTEALRLPELQTVPHVDLQRYLGTWYEIAAFPQSFQRDCTATTATYSLRSDGDIDVLNRCRKFKVDGEVSEARGRARVVDKVSNAKLEVSFFRPFWGDYWVIQLGDGYDYAVVGHPERDYLWILARTPTLPPPVYAAILAQLQTQRYDTKRLVLTQQPPGPLPAK